MWNLIAKSCHCDGSNACLVMDKNCLPSYKNHNSNYPNTNPYYMSSLQYRNRQQGHNKKIINNSLSPSSVSETALSLLLWPHYCTNIWRKCKVEIKKHFFWSLGGVTMFYREVWSACCHPLMAAAPLAKQVQYWPQTSWSIPTPCPGCWSCQTSSLVDQKQPSPKWGYGNLKQAPRKSCSWSVHFPNIMLAL